MDVAFAAEGRDSEMSLDTQTPVQAGEEPIFALDLGTRSVIGIVGELDGELFRVAAVERMDHPKRAMIDGQIEDIDQAARVAGLVKSRLEDKLGYTLRSVCVAAAGRALKTQKAHYTVQLNPKENIGTRDVSEIELHAVQRAYETLAGQEENGDFYCVGYSVVRYTLDGYPIQKLEGHRGKEADVEIIATFLPNAVVESLYTAMNAAGLSISSLTLEPIAAMNAIIPQDIRLLNLALVDIGAGTSDIAISNAGSVAAYTMATVAGDEITEAIIRQFLVDFETAERIKRGLALGGEQQICDVLGLEHVVSAAEILEKVKPAADNLCQTICDKILEANGQAPAAVFLVGGGSQLPGLCASVASRLEIDPGKVAVGSTNYMKRMVDSPEDIGGPDFATPVGIALTAALARERSQFSITLNGEEVRVTRRGSLSVMDALLYCGYQHTQIMGRSGQSVTYEINGQKKTARGSLPEPAQIHVNGKAAILSTPVYPGDSLEVRPAVQGSDASPLLRDAVDEWNPFQVTLDGIEVSAGTIAEVNGKQELSPERAIGNFDSVTVRQVRTLAALCREAEIDMEAHSVTVNGAPEDGDYLLSPGDDIRLDEAPAPAASPASAQEEEPPHPLGGVARSGEAVLSVVLNGDRIPLRQKEDGSPYQFVDMLNFVDIDPSKPQGNIVLRLNGRPASFIETVQDGDEVEIFWETRGVSLF